LVGLRQQNQQGCTPPIRSPYQDGNTLPETTGHVNQLVAIRRRSVVSTNRRSSFPPSRARLFIPVVSASTIQNQLHTGGILSLPLHCGRPGWSHFGLQLISTCARTRPAVRPYTQCVHAPKVWRCPPAVCLPLSARPVVGTDPSRHPASGIGEPKPDSKVRAYDVYLEVRLLT